MSYPIIILVGAVSFVLDINSTPPEELVGEIMHREGVVAAKEETDAMVQDQQGIAPAQDEGTNARAKATGTTCTLRIGHTVTNCSYRFNHGGTD